MINPLDMRAHALREKAGMKHPQIAEIKIDADVKDFDEALDEIYQRCEALINIAPPDKVEGLQQVCESLNGLKHAKTEIDKGGDEESMEHEKTEAPEEEVSEHKGY